MKPIEILRWTARLLSVLAIAFVIAIVLAVGMFDRGLAGLIDLTVDMQIEMGVYALFTIGLLVAWGWEAQGGALALMATIGSYAFGSSTNMGAWGVSAMTVPALLFLVIGLYESMKKP